MTDTQFCLKKYGDPSTKAFRDQWMVLFDFPAWMDAIWPRYQGQPVTKQWVNRDLKAPLEAVFAELKSTGLYKELKTFDGLWVVRLKRGLNEYSIHSWGLAVDFNAAFNPLGVKWGSRPGMFSKAFLDVWRRHGFTCGADFARGDAMHFQYAHD